MRNRYDRVEQTISLPVTSKLHRGTSSPDPLAPSLAGARRPAPLRPGICVGDTEYRIIVSTRINTERGKHERFR